MTHSIRQCGQYEAGSSDWIASVRRGCCTLRPARGSSCRRSTPGGRHTSFIPDEPRDGSSTWPLRRQFSPLAPLPHPGGACGRLKHLSAPLGVDSGWRVGMLAQQECGWWRANTRTQQRQSKCGLGQAAAVADGQLGGAAGASSGGLYPCPFSVRILVRGRASRRQHRRPPAWTLLQVSDAAASVTSDSSQPGARARDAAVKQGPTISAQGVIRTAAGLLRTEAPVSAHDGSTYKSASPSLDLSAGAAARCHPRGGAPRTRRRRRPGPRWRPQVPHGAQPLKIERRRHESRVPNGHAALR
jgi:hypothetical protein